MKLRKCPYCLFDEHESEELWFANDKMKDHINMIHPEKDYRTIEDMYNAWKVMAMYEEKEV